MKKTRVKITIALLVSLLIISCAESNPAAEKDGLQAADKWLAVVDSRAYGDSWTEAGSLFQSQISQDQWIDTVGKVRAPLGPVLNRKNFRNEYTTTMAGAPDGEYVVCQYTTQYTNRKAAIETITVMKNQDNGWRVVGYFIN